MGLFDKIFNNNLPKDEIKKPNWNELTNMETLDEIAEISKTKLVAIFKHSTSCIISRMVLKQFEQNYESNDQVKLYFLDLLSNRDISNKIASRFNVRHESPQLIVLKNEKAIYNASHNGIKAEKLKEIIG